MVTGKGKCYQVDNFLNISYEINGKYLFAIFQDKNYLGSLVKPALSII
jgi:hypothetical protein